MTAPYIFLAVSKKGPRQARGCAAFLTAVENICIGETLMVSEKPQQAAVRAWAAETCGHGNTDNPLVLQSHLFFLSNVVIFSIPNHSRESISFSVMLSGAAGHVGCCPKVSCIGENALQPGSWRELGFTKVHRKFTVASTEAKPAADAHGHFPCSLLSAPQ